MNRKKDFYISLSSLTAFALWTILVCFVDVRPIGPNETEVGLALINSYVHRLTGINITLYTVTDWLGLVPFIFIIGFGILGLLQWIKRKYILKVDWSILALGGFYIITMAVYIFFEIVVINYRPILINGYLEASYPSSTTMLVMCVMPTAIMQFNSRIKNKILKLSVSLSITAFTVFMVAGRLISGVHWFSDIVGGAMLSIGLVMMYRYITNMKNSIKIRHKENPENRDGFGVFEHSEIIQIISLRTGVHDELP